ncbi:13225_t:CDS:2, partial [Funneliformis geosporum]
MVAVSDQPYPQAGLTANQELLVSPLVILGQEIPLEFQWNPEDTFQGLIKVRLDEHSQPSAGDDSKRDYGAPVYYPTFDRLGLITQVKPVGILLAYIQETENRNNQCVR